MLYLPRVVGCGRVGWMYFSPSLSHKKNRCPTAPVPLARCWGCATLLGYHLRFCWHCQGAQSCQSWCWRNIIDSLSLLSDQFFSSPSVHKSEVWLYLCVPIFAWFFWGLVRCPPATILGEGPVGVHGVNMGHLDPIQHDQLDEFGLPFFLDFRRNQSKQILKYPSNVLWCFCAPTRQHPHTSGVYLPEDCWLDCRWLLLEIKSIYSKSNQWDTFHLIFWNFKSNPDKAYHH